MNENLFRPQFDTLKLSDKLWLMQTLATRYNLTFKELYAFSRWGQSCTTGLFEKDGREFVFIPGDTVILGWESFVQGMGAKKRRCMSMSKKRLLSIVVSAVILLSFACTAMAAEKSERYVGDSTVNGSIYQTYYQVDAQTRTGVKKISVSGVLYEKGTIGTWQKVSSCSNSSTTSTCMVSSSFNTKPGKSYRLEYSATFSYSDGRSETITGSTSR